MPKIKRKHQQHRYQKARSENLLASQHNLLSASKAPDCVVNCGWGRLIFGQTFSSTEKMVSQLLKEESGTRDIAFYIKDPHIVLNHSPAHLFLDPSHTFRIWFENYRPAKTPKRNLLIRRIQSKTDIPEIETILRARNMVPIDPLYLWKKRRSKDVFPLVAESLVDNQIVGFVIGLNHVETFDDFEKGSSLWSLAVSPTASLPGVGEALTRYLIEYFQATGNSFLDLSVMHDNESAIKLYEKLGFQRVPVFAVKIRNTFNEPLYTQAPVESLNPYAEIIVREAIRRGLQVDIVDPKLSLFTISSGARKLRMRESLSDLTSAYSFLLCDNKTLTNKVLAEASLQVPEQVDARDKKGWLRLLDRYSKVVVKPISGEQGRGVYVGLESIQSVELAIAQLISTGHRSVIVEQMVKGFDVRIIVIGKKFVAAAVREPPQVTGDGRTSLRELIEKQSRRRSQATGGESKIPIDEEMLRCLHENKVGLDDVLDVGQTLVVRKASNVHQGGTIKDVTPLISPFIQREAERAAQALDIPVVGFDFMMKAISGNHYVIIEANERPGLANHEPQPVVEKYIDLLFPETAYATNNAARDQQIEEALIENPQDRH
ncbi:MAG: N-acetylglutaminylglutamine synthetase [Bdellovibrionales bacterium CG10_big_fil_rev_8_21_14_0_10_45_34]|nr:MAG: N-acetylglutaminylglutamine synthetase [Bdellovibrionales bacterium CG10_big_fil_rev_8_21_14_0_10_45_34]